MVVECIPVSGMDPHLLFKSITELALLSSKYDIGGRTCKHTHTHSQFLCKKTLYFRFGQCWIACGIAVSLLRSLGIPCRPVTCYEAAFPSMSVRGSKRFSQIHRYFTTEGDPVHELETDRIWYDAINTCNAHCSHVCTSIVNL